MLTRTTFIIAIVLWFSSVRVNTITAAEPVKIVAFGDSTTAVRGTLKVYASVLQQELRNIQTINAGVGGHTTELARQRFEKDVLKHQPRIVIIQFGINDAAVDVWKTPPATTSRISLQRYEENLRHFVKALQQNEAIVVLMTPTPLRWTPKLKELYGRPPYRPEDADGFNTILEKYCQVVRQVAKEEGTELLDMQRIFVDEAKKKGQAVDALLADGMHPNEAGHRIEADQLRELILAIAKRQQLPITAEDN